MNLKRLRVMLIKLIYRLVFFILSNLFKLKNLFLFRVFKVKFEKGLRVNGPMFIRSFGQLEIGHNVTINSSYSSNPIGGNSFTSVVVMKGAKVVIGNNVGISNSAIYCMNEITIGDGAMIGGDCKIYDTDFHSLDWKSRQLPNDQGSSLPVTIGERSFIGTGCIILKGSKIGVGSVIGAGSVVSTSIPDNQIWAGNPIKYIKDV
ncbi:hypothetical protein P0F32_003026 [Vibrio metschnikovii]|nr:hypothetical protein [Vibrio metschnikovii]